MTVDKSKSEAEAALNRLLESSAQLLGAVENSDWTLADRLAKQRHRMATTLPDAVKENTAELQLLWHKYQAIEHKLRQKISERSTVSESKNASAQKLRKYQQD